VVLIKRVEAAVQIAGLSSLIQPVLLQRNLTATNTRFWEVQWSPTTSSIAPSTAQT
jgi:hypothetical protein